LCTARTEFRVPWPLRAHHTQLTLSRLATRQTYELVAQVAGGATLHKEVADAVVARSDGVPIFAEELTKAALEVGARGAREIPDTLAGSLLARLDRLGPAARDVALVASVLGREFSRPLLRAVLGIGESELDGALRKLVDAELAWVRGAEPDPIYTFKHALVCDAAYGSLLRSRRRELHGRVARALSERFPATGASRPDVLAHHFSEAGALGPAAENWLRAGEQAFARGANGEALGHAERALVLVAQLPGRAERDALELQLQLLRVRALTFAKGPATPEAVDALDRAVALSSRSQDSFQQGFLLAGLFAQVSSREGAAAAGPIAERLVEVAERAGVRPIQAWGHFSRGMSRYFAGDVELAYGSFQRALGLCDGEPPMRVPIDPRVALLPYLALTAWYLGRADEARTRSREATELAQRLGQPAERAWAESFAGLLWLILREPEAAIEHAEAALAACAEEPNAMQEAMTTSLRGAALTELGDVATGLALACAGVERFRAIGERISLESTLGFLADAHANAGKEREALRILEEAEGIVPGEELHRSDTLRRRAALLERVGAPPEEAEAAHRGAIAWARKKGALALELRGALGYARFLHDHDRSAEARALLTPLIDCLSEGGDTRDLRDATELLAQLEGRDRVGT
jgi:tetratricopeptide (TPR) repeat protein